MNTKHIILIVTLLIVGLFSCDNYVQFETAQPTDATVATTVPELFQGTYINPQDPNMAFTINEDGIYKYTSVRLPRLDSDKIKTSDCNLATDTFYTQPNGKKSQCVSVDFSSYPDSTITLLHFREALPLSHDFRPIMNL